MIVDLFLRSYVGDIQWVTYALRSIHKFVSGIRNIVIVVPANDFDRFNRLNLTREILRSSKLKPMRYDYCAQQADKLIADQYSGAEYILYWDSDVIAIRPFSPSDLMIDGKPRCIETPFSKIVKSDGTPDAPWQPIVERALGHPVAKERMRQHPFLTHRRALAGFRDYMQKLHGMSMIEYVAAQSNHEMSEFNFLHSWAAHHDPGLFTFWDTERGVPEPFIKQYWSHGLTPEIQAEIERALS